MKNLDAYIEDLLFKHQCVIIPEFGAFVSNRKAAELAADKTFSPMLDLLIMMVYWPNISPR